MNQDTNKNQEYYNHSDISSQTLQYSMVSSNLPSEKNNPSIRNIDSILSKYEFLDSKNLNFNKKN